MSLTDDLHTTAVTAATHALAAFFPDAAAQRLQEAAEAALDAAAPFQRGADAPGLTGAERAQLEVIAAEVRGGTVTP